jgi:hypothetical protein
VIGIDDLVDFEFMSRPKEMSLVKALELLYLRSPFAFISTLIRGIGTLISGIGSLIWFQAAVPLPLCSVGAPLLRVGLLLRSNATCPTRRVTTCQRDNMPT